MDNANTKDAMTKNVFIVYPFRKPLHLNSTGLFDLLLRNLSFFQSWNRIAWKGENRWPTILLSPE